MLRRLRAALVVVAAVVLVPVTALAPAGAADPTDAQPATVELVPGPDPFEGQCVGKRPKHILRLYDLAMRDFRIPLRCGRHDDATGKGFGWRHIKARHDFDSTVEFWMAAALANPDDFHNRGTPTAWRYIIYVDAREMVVGWDGRHAYEGDVHPQKGIITCFFRIHTT
jgi:hypothetical protein